MEAHIFLIKNAVYPETLRVKTFTNFAPLLPSAKFVHMHGSAGTCRGQSAKVFSAKCYQSAKVFSAKCYQSAKVLPAKVSGYTVVPQASCVKLIVCKLSVCFFAGSVFSINATTGVVTVTGSVNFEMGQEHELSVEASDRGNPRRSQVAALHVLIRNEEDESPRFPISFYTASINEGTRVTYPCLHT